MSMNNERSPHTLLIPIGALAGGATAHVVGPVMLRDAVILSAHLVDKVAIAASGSNYVTATLLDATASQNLATGNTIAGLAAFAGLALPLVPTPNDAHEGGPNSGGPGVQQTIIDRGDAMEVTVVSTGTAALTNAALSVTMYYL